MEGQRLRQDLAHVGRVATVGELTASLAHELNQPLTAILANAQAARRILESDTADLMELRAIVGDIVDDDKRASEVINRLRGFLKKGTLERSRVDMGELVSQVARLVAAMPSFETWSLGSSSPPTSLPCMATGCSCSRWF